MTTPRWLRWALLLALIAALGWGIGRALLARSAQKTEAAVAAERQATAPVYELPQADTLVAAPVTLIQSVDITGTVTAVRSATVKARSAGELQGLSVREGERVRAGQWLGRINNSDAEARVRQAQQQAQAAQAQVNMAQRQLDNNQALVSQGFISRTALQTAQDNFTSANATYQAALAALDIARKGQSDTRLIAPIDGLVATRAVQNGERVTPEMRVLDIVDLSALEVEAALTPAQVLVVREGQQAVLRIEGSPQTVSARVSRISPSAQAGSRNVLVYLQLDAVTGLRQGLFAQGQLQVGEVTAIAVPLSAVRQDKPRPYVQWLQEGKVVHQSVTLGARGQLKNTSDAASNNEAWVAVSPLPENAQVLRVSAGLLSEGTAVKLQPSPAPDTAAAQPAAQP